MFNPGVEGLSLFRRWDSFPVACAGSGLIGRGILMIVPRVWEEFVGVTDKSSNFYHILSPGLELSFGYIS